MEKQNPKELEHVLRYNTAGGYCRLIKWQLERGEGEIRTQRKTKCKAEQKSLALVKVKENNFMP